MGNALSKGQNNLEVYLNDVFEKECVSDISDEEITFIQSGIETLVQKIADSVLNDGYMKNELKNFADLPDKEKVGESPARVFGVGSFYEKTKNGFPDEFDFIFLLGACDKVEQNFKEHLVELIVEHIVEHVFQRSREDFATIIQGSRRLCFISAHYTKGPALCLLFQYANTYEERMITVDLVPAFKCSNLSCLEDISGICALEPFSKEILSTGYYLQVYAGSTTFTASEVYTISTTFVATEVNFMRKVLSKNHVKVYRILKFLINGHGDGENLQRFFQQQLYFPMKHYSTYKIKTMVIYHHYECTRPDRADFAPCVLQVLNEICKFGDNGTFPRIVRNPKPFEDQHELCLKDYIASLAEILQEMKKHGDSYDYEKSKINQSVSKRYANDSNITLTDFALFNLGHTLGIPID